MAAEAKHNMKNTAVKRILQELKELEDNPSDDFISLPLEVNVNADAGPLRFRISIKVRQRRRMHVNPNEQLHQPGGRRLGAFVDRILTLHQHGTRQLSALADRVLTFAAFGLTLTIAVLVVKKLLKCSYGLGVMDGL